MMSFKRFFRFLAALGPRPASRRGEAFPRG